ncbi:MAG: DsbC family protein [Geobacter sp.]|nr:DsbC family protein [Geobacter sp.]
MIKSVFSVIGLVIPLAFIAGTASGFGAGAEGCGSDCAACHSFKKEEAQGLLKELAPDINVVDVAPAPVRGLFQVFIKKGKDDGVVYVDYSKKYVVSGAIIDVGRKRDVTREQLEDRKQVNVAAIPLDNALVMGNRNGTRKLYVFTDPECPFCAKFHEELTAMVKEDKDLLVYIFLYPLDIHPDSLWKTDAIVCASKKNMERALQMLEDSFAKKSLEKDACGSEYGKSAKKLANELGLAMTPSIVLADGKVIFGAKKKDELRKLIDEHTPKVAEKK